MILVNQFLYAWDINDNYVSMANWLYQSLRLLNRDDEAKKLLEKAVPDMDVIENQVYLDVLLMYKSRYDPNMKDVPSLSYGVAFWHKINGNEEKAVKILKNTISKGNWAAFNYIASEVEYKRMGYTP